MDKNLIRLLIKEIEQNIRSHNRTIRTFIDFNEILKRAKNERNQIFFGRRGSGKTLLINNYLKDYPFTYHAQINVEKVKNLTLSDSIIRTVIEILESYEKQVFLKKKFNTYLPIFTPRIIKRIRSIKKEFTELLKTPDNVTHTLSQTDDSEIAGKVLKFGLGVSANLKNTSESIKEFKDNKLRELNNKIPQLKNILDEISETLASSKIYLSLDDFYFIPQQNQPYFLDFFHNLCKENNVILKISTIKHRTVLNKQNDTFVGVELGDDIQSIDLDYTLDSFHLLEDFLMKLLIANIESSYATSLKPKDILSSKSFKLLCVASGGVPRDFLNYMLNICELLLNGRSKINLKDILEIISDKLSDKKEFLIRDSGADQKKLLEYLTVICKEVIEDKKTNIFLVPNNLKELNRDFDQSIKELNDLRFIHHLSDRVNMKKTNKYSAYLIDMCLYANLVLTKEFNYQDITKIKGKFKELENMPIIENIAL